ncbi:MAG: hypothetical protein WD118_11440 [Phycisphaeraceae bacterium]
MTTVLGEAQAELGILEVIRRLGYDYALGSAVAHEAGPRTGEMVS